MVNCVKKNLYKGKCLENGKWMEGYYQSRKDVFEEIEHLIFQFKSYRVWEYVKVDPETICQYTGLDDKDGDKIWEYDVVDFLGHKGVVTFECGAFGIAFNDPIDWDEIANNILPVTGCNNSLRACENDYFISLWEIYENFNEGENSLSVISRVGSMLDYDDLGKALKIES